MRFKVKDSSYYPNIYDSNTQDISEAKEMCDAVYDSMFEVLGTFKPINMTYQYQHQVNVRPGKDIILTEVSLKKDIYVLWGLQGESDSIFYICTLKTAIENQIKELYLANEDVFEILE